MVCSRMGEAALMLKAGRVSMGINFDVLNLGVVSCKILQRHSSLPLLCPCSFSKSFHACDSKIPVVQCAVVSHKAILAGPQEPTAGAESPWGHLAGETWQPGQVPWGGHRAADGQQLALGRLAGPGHCSSPVQNALASPGGSS